MFSIELEIVVTKENGVTGQRGDGEIEQEKVRRQVKEDWAETNVQLVAKDR